MALDPLQFAVLFVEGVALDLQKWKLHLSFPQSRGSCLERKDKTRHALAGYPQPAPNGGLMLLLLGVDLRQQAQGLAFPAGIALLRSLKQREFKS